MPKTMTPACVDGTGAHRIRIREQNGTPIVDGTCSRCGWTREYASSEESISFVQSQRRQRFGVESAEAYEAA